MGKNQSISNITNSFIVFISMASIFIIVVLILLFTIRHHDNECRHSRSDGQTVKFCYNDNLYCAIANSEQLVAVGSMSLRQDTEDTICFGTDFQIGLCYGSCVPETSNCISFGSQELGYCTDTSTVYLKGAVSDPTNFPNVAGSLISSLIDDTQTNMEVFLDEDEDEIIFVANGTNNEFTSIISTVGTNGIFGQTSIPFQTKQNENFFQPANENLLNVNKRLKNINAFRKIESPTVAEGLSQTWACVDPGFVFPCNGRIFDGISLFCYADGTCCVKFCSHGYYNTTYENLTKSDTNSGVGKLDPGQGYYQTTGFGTNLENSSYKPKASVENKYSKGSVETPGNIPSDQQIAQSSLPNNYLQDRVFCAGTAPGICNVISGPINSSYPTPSARGQFTIGF